MLQHLLHWSDAHPVLAITILAIGFIMGLSLLIAALFGFFEDKPKSWEEPKRSFLDRLFEETEDTDDVWENDDDQTIETLTNRFPSNVVSFPQGVVTYVIPSTSAIARIGSYLGKEKIEERIKGLVAGNPDISEDELRAALKSYMVLVVSYRQSGRRQSGRLTI